MRRGSSEDDPLLIWYTNGGNHRPYFTNIILGLLFGGQVRQIKLTLSGIMPFSSITFRANEQD